MVEQKASIFIHFYQAWVSSQAQIYYSFWLIIFCPPAVSFSSGTWVSAEPRTQICLLMVVRSYILPWGNTHRRQGYLSSIILELNINDRVLLFCAYWRSCSRLAYYCYIFSRSRSLSFLPAFLSSFFLLLITEVILFVNIIQCIKIMHRSM